MMGLITIDRLASIEVDDELLDHVFAVLIAKLRRHEPVLLQWYDERGCREQAFVNPTRPLIVVFDSAERSRLDRGRLARLMIAANSTGGICLAAAAECVEAGIPTARV
jgi:hypothetical protein